MPDKKGVLFAAVPLARSALILFWPMGCRDNCFRPLIYLSSNRKFALAVGLPYFLGKYTSKWNVVMAASTLVVTPCAIAFLLGQKHIIGGIALSGLKA